MVPAPSSGFSPNPAPEGCSLLEEDDIELQCLFRASSVSPGMLQSKQGVSFASFCELTHAFCTAEACPAPAWLCAE